MYTLLVVGVLPLYRLITIAIQASLWLIVVGIIAISIPEARKYGFLSPPSRPMPPSADPLDTRPTVGNTSGLWDVDEAESAVTGKEADDAARSDSRP